MSLNTTASHCVNLHHSPLVTSNVLFTVNRGALHSDRTASATIIVCRQQEREPRVHYGRSIVQCQQTSHGHPRSQCRVDIVLVSQSSYRGLVAVVGVACIPTIEMTSAAALYVLRTRSHR